MTGAFEFQDLMSRLAVAFGAGLLIGLERGWRTRADAAGSRTAGIRTFALTGVLGGVAGAAAQALGGLTEPPGGLFLGLAFATYAGVMAMFFREENRSDRIFSATSAVAAMLTFALGAFAVLGDVRAAGAIAVVVALVLAMREPIHGWVARITWPELRSGLVLLAMTFVVLPVLPDRAIGPLGGLNLREVWLIAITLAAVSFLGYAAVKVLGQSRGILLAGLAGGLASSTAVTVTSARRAAEGDQPHGLLAAGVALANAVMFVRVIGIVAALNAGLLSWVVPALAAGAATACAFALVLVLLQTPGAAIDRPSQFSNPFGFRQVIGFALFLGLIIVAGRVLGEAFGASGAIAGAAVLGTADVDALTVSLSKLAPATISSTEAGIAILTAVAANTLSKIGLGTALGRGRFVVLTAGMGIACILAGGGALWLTVLAMSR